VRILIRATNWLGDAVMSLPAIHAMRDNYRSSEITLLARRSVADLYAREKAIDQLIVHGDSRWKTARALRARKFHIGILFPNSFDSALVLRLAGIPQIVGYSTDMRRLLLTHPVPTPLWKGTVHERYYYLELLQGARLIDGYHGADVPIHMQSAPEAAAEGVKAFTERGIVLPAIGVSPGAAYGGAKCWLPERFAESAAGLVARQGGTVVLFGAPNDAEDCLAVEKCLHASGVAVANLAGQTSLRQFIDLAAACTVILTNDSGAMHVASALGVPTVAIFGATNPQTTGPAGPRNAVVREKVSCSPCFERECPIDHRCMTNVTAARVLDAASNLIQVAKARP
jgi:heptosyltransferase-2